MDILSKYVPSDAVFAVLHAPVGEVFRSVACTDGRSVQCSVVFSLWRNWAADYHLSSAQQRQSKQFTVSIHNSLLFCYNAVH